MIKHLTRVSVTLTCIVFALANPGAAPPPQAFAADLVTVAAGGKAPQVLGGRGRVYVSSGSVRIEAPGFADGFFIVDGGSSAAFFVRPRQRLYMDAQQSSPLTQLLVSVDPDNPCPRWQAMAASAVSPGGGEWRCDRLGTDLVGGRETLKYLAVSGGGLRSYRWIDPHLEFPVRIEAEDGTMVALEHIVAAAQPSGFFTIPSDYHKFDPRQLIEIVKQSDVWVETPR